MGRTFGRMGESESFSGGSSFWAEDLKRLGGAHLRHAYSERVLAVGPGCICRVEGMVSTPASRKI